MLFVVPTPMPVATDIPMASPRVPDMGLAKALANFALPATVTRPSLVLSLFKRMT